MLRAIEDYLRHLRVLAHASQSLYNRRLILRSWADWMETQKKITGPNDVRLSHLESWVGDLFLARNASRTVRSKVWLMRDFFAHLVRTGRLAKNPALGLAVPKADHPLPRQAPEAGKLRDFINHLPVATPVQIRNKAILEVLFCSGIRRSELLNLELGDVNLAERTLAIRSGKGYKDRTALLSRRAAACLAEYIGKVRPVLLSGTTYRGWAARSREKNIRPPRNALWLLPNTNVLTMTGINGIFRLWAEKRWGGPFYPHLIRHAFAVHLLQQGVDILAVKTLLGHDDLESTKIYTQLFSTDHKRIYDRAMPVISVRVRRRKR